MEATIILMSGSVSAQGERGENRKAPVCIDLIPQSHHCISHFNSTDKNSRRPQTKLAFEMPAVT